jgi:hypothetical protein
MEFRLSDHAATRAAQRNLSALEIDFLLENGRLTHNTGVIFGQLRAKDVPDDLPGNHPFRRLVGTTVVLCRCGYTVVTVYREARAFHGDLCKTRYNQRKGHWAACPFCEVVA